MGMASSLCTKSSMTQKQEPTIDSIDNVGTTKWLALKTINYTDAKGVKRKWDVATRTTKQGKDKPDAVVIIPILKSSKSNILDTILVSQFRPPMGLTTLEFPAGLVDENETAAVAAVREMREETGYFGTADEDLQSMLLCMSPGLTDEAIQIIAVNVDLDDPRNVNPDQMLDDGEDIELTRVPLLKGLKKMLDEKSNEMPIAMLYSFALGLELGLKHGNVSEC
jgi:8-oxo-dGTP pyrophosphatase MutT (NUDIX family)